MTINLSSATAEKCTTDCELSFDYKETNLTVQNGGNVLSFGVDPVMTPPVVYNNKKYTPIISAVIYDASSNPSISYDNVPPAAFFVVIHQSGSNRLLMMIPIIESSTNQTSASAMLTKVLEDSASKAISQNTEAKLTVYDFSFQSIFPTNSPFFVINDNNSSTNVFFKNPISIEKTVLDKLKQIIQPLTGGMGITSSKVYYNETGAGSNALIKDEEIYIDCQPVNSSKETIEYVTKNPFKNDLSTILNNPITYLILQLILSSIVFLVLYFVLSKGFQFMTLGKMPIPTRGNA